MDKPPTTDKHNFNRAFLWRVELEPGKKHSLKYHARWGTLLREVISTLDFWAAESPVRFIDTTIAKLLKQLNRDLQKTNRKCGERELKKILAELRARRIIAGSLNWEDKLGFVVAPHDSLCYKSGNECVLHAPRLGEYELDKMPAEYLKDGEAVDPRGCQIDTLAQVELAPLLAPELALELTPLLTPLLTPPVDTPKSPQEAGGEADADAARENRAPPSSLHPQPTHPTPQARAGVCKRVGDQDEEDLFTWFAKIWLRRRHSRDQSLGWTDKTRVAARAAVAQHGVKTVAHAFQLFRDHGSFDSKTKYPVSLFVNDIEVWITKTNDAKVNWEPFETAAEKRARERGITVAEAEKQINKEVADGDFAAAAAESDRIRANSKPRVEEVNDFGDIADILG